MLMSLREQSSRNVPCSYLTKDERTCKAIVTWFCTSCKRFACGVHVMREGAGPLCAHCEHSLKHLGD
jgi:hypothetical protein